MGLFKSNYYRIAENTTKYYLELTRKYSQQIDNEVTALATAGTLDAQRYVISNKSSISVSELMTMALGAVVGKESVAEKVRLTYFEENYYKAQRKGKGSFLETPVIGADPLTDFILSLEVRIFEIDNPRIDSADIITACSRKIPTILEAIQKTKAKYIGEWRISRSTVPFLFFPRFKTYREKLGIIEKGSAEKCN